MGIRAKHIVISLAVLGAGWFFVQDRVKKLTAIMTKLNILPTGIRNIRIESWILKFNLDITIYNPTIEDFNPNGLIVNLKRLEIKDSTGVLIGKMNINKTSVNVPAKGKLTLDNLLVEIDVDKSIKNLSSLVKIKSIDDIRVDVIIGLLGSEYVIPQNQ